MDEEAVLLVEEGVAVLVDDPNAHFEPSAGQVTQWTKQNPPHASNSNRVAKKPSENRNSQLSEAALEKRRARQQKRNAEIATSEDLFHVPQESAQPEDPSQSDTQLLITRSSSSFPWYQPGQHSYSTLDAASSAGIWTYPSTPMQRARCAAFRHLWSQGYFLGIGIKFGGDFLVYPGDPLRYHSHFCATVHFKSDPLRPLEIVAHGRLGTGTRKSHLICSWDQETQKIECFSIEWAGFG